MGFVLLRLQFYIILPLQLKAVCNEGLKFFEQKYDKDIACNLKFHLK